MTTPAAPQEAPTLSRKLYILWSTALTLLLALGLFSWLVVVPLVRLHRMFGRVPVSYEKIVEHYGGRERAVHISLMYYRLPQWLAPRKGQCVNVAIHCGQHGRPLLESALTDDQIHLRLFAVFYLLSCTDPQVEEKVFRALENAASSSDLRSREKVAELLGLRVPPYRGTVPLLIRMLEDAEWTNLGTPYPAVRTVRMHAARSLGALGRYAEPAIPALQRLAADKTDGAQKAAAEALRKLKSAESAKKPPE